MIATMLNPYQKKKLTIQKHFIEKTEAKPSILAVFEHFDDRHQRLIRSGNRTMACCPFHGEHRPSFAMYKATNTYFCFACGATGDSYKFIMEIEQIDFKATLQFAKDNNLYDNI